VDGEEIKRFAGTDEQKPVVSVPDIAGIAVIVIKPKLALVAIQVEHVEKAVRINNMQNATNATALRSQKTISRLYLIQYLLP
jgi:hypothetical protein